MNVATPKPGSITYDGYLPIATCLRCELRIHLSKTANAWQHTNTDKIPCPDGTPAR